MSDMIYLDHAATTPLDARVLEAMLPYLTERHWNASSLYGPARGCRRAVEESREVAAAFLGARPSDIIFTSGGTESDNLALRGVLSAAPPGKRHLITTRIEHHAVLHTAQALERVGVRVTYLDPDRTGRVTAEQVESEIRPDTGLISVMHGNNEVGSLQPIGEIGSLARSHRILFHVDAVQTAGQVPIRVREIPCDLLSLSGHKMYGPKGTGVLYRRTGLPVAEQMTGGDQEFGLRAGTENVAGIVGLAAAMELAHAELATTAASETRRLRDLLITGVLGQALDASLTGHPQQRLPNHASFLFPGVEGESLLLNLDLRGICGSSGAACASGEIEPSHVLLAMGFSPTDARGALRLTLGRGNTESQIQRTVAALRQIVPEVRGLATPG